VNLCSVKSNTGKDLIRASLIGCQRISIICCCVVVGDDSNIMSAEEDTELRDLVAQTLEANGVLGKIRVRLLLIHLLILIA